MAEKTEKAQGHMPLCDTANIVLYCDGISQMSAEQFRFFFDWMPQERKRKALRYIRMEDRQLCVAAYALLRYGLYLIGYDLDAYSITANESGKPHPVDAPFTFNISHTADAVACAVSDAEIGVDIQENIFDYDSVMRRVCAQGEIDLMASSENPVRDFTRIWSLKESYVKCIGTGISDDIFRYDFSELVQKRKGSIYGHQFCSIDTDRFCLSVCASKPIDYIKKIPLSELYTFLGRKRQ